MGRRSHHILTGPKCASQYPQDIPLGKILFDELQKHGTKVCQVFYNTGEQLTGQGILDSSCKLAIYLQQNGLKFNDRIAICSENNLGFSIPVCAALFLGATVCPLNPLYSELEFHHTVNISKPKYIFVSPLIAETVKDFVGKLHWSPKLILTLDHADIDIPSINQLSKDIAPSTLRRFKVNNQEATSHVTAIMCSSGTTGMPKGVMLTDRNYITMLNTQSDPDAGFVNSESILALLPFFHSYCFATMIISLIFGLRSVIFSHFDEELFLEAIEKYQIDILTVVPPLMVFFAKHPLVDRYNLSSVKMIICGAAPLSGEVEASVKKRLNISDIRQGYGMTETTLAVLKCPKDNKKEGSVGTLEPGVLAKVTPINDDGTWSDEAMGPNCVGELCFKGDLIMKGYCDDEVSTSKTIDKEGWLHTGDVGYYDEDGYFYIVDRLKELIKYKGYQVPPAELEAILLTNPNITDAAVVGVPDEMAGELPFAFVVLKENVKLTPEDVIKFVSERVSNQKRLRGGVRFLETIPKTASGKILRRELRDMLKSKL